MLVLLILFFPIFLGGCSGNENEEYLRVHIRANSNSETDQEIKYYVKDVVVTYLSPLVKDCKSKADAVEVVSLHLDDIEAVVDAVLLEKGFSYSSNVKINNEFFPTKSYGDLTLESGYYDALIINIGSGSGNNWWCVMYPNICFNEPKNVVYRSKILEIIQKVLEGK